MSSNVRPEDCGRTLWGKAKGLIPGGSMLLSKRSEQFLPDQWPSYYSKAKGIEVWDLNGKSFLDFSTMSVGACSLGYGVENIDSAVKSAVDEGVMSSLNSPAEVFLAEELVRLHEWSDMVRFARSGGEANAIAVRIARSHTQKDKVAICGYHGWHDWYLAANLDSDSNLDGHLLPGLSPIGVPRALAGSTIPFAFNDADSLEDLLMSGDFAAVQMEVTRNWGPEPGFLDRVRKLCNKYGAVLIFDECTSGFRETFGGLHLRFGVQPDIAMFGKALGNGFAISAVIGRQEIMQAAQMSFISSTFWTERLGPVAALATLKEMEKLRSWETLPAVGREIKEVWKRSFEKAGFDVLISGLDALPTFHFRTADWGIIRTFFTQEMLKRGYLASANFYPSVAHTPESLKDYESAVGEVVELLMSNNSKAALLDLLDGPVAHDGFKRLN